MRSRTATRTLVALVTALGLTLGLVVVTSGPLAAEPREERPCGELPDGVTTQMRYNNPETEAKDTIRDHLAELICGAEQGTEIMVGAHYFGDAKIRENLVDKYKHDDVRVKVIVDGGAVQEDELGNYAEYKELQEALGSDRSADSWADHCRGATRACIGGGKDDYEDALMHNKFFLFEQTKGANKVVVQTSQNFREGRSGTGMWNTAFTVADEPSVYDHYKAYFDDLAAENPKQDDYYHDNDLPQPDGDKYEVFHSPSGGSSNPLEEQLKRVDCTNDQNSGGTKGGRTIVRVANWNISGDKWDDTGTRLARRLNYMDDQGCYVDVVADRLGTGKGAVDGPLEALLRTPSGKFHGPEVRKFYKGERSDGTTQKGLHSKDIMINGTFDGKTDQKVVLTGTHNFTWKSARVNDETTLVIKDAEAYEDFSDFFITVRKKASLTYQTSKYKR